MSEANGDDPGGAQTTVPTGIAVYCVATGLLTAIAVMLALPVFLDPEAADRATLLQVALVVVKFLAIYGLLTLRTWGWVLEVLWLVGSTVRSLLAEQLLAAVFTVGLILYFLAQYQVYDVSSYRPSVKD